MTSHFNSPFRTIARAITLSRNPAFMLRAVILHLVRMTDLPAAVIVSTLHAAAAEYERPIDG